MDLSQKQSSAIQSRVLDVLSAIRTRSHAHYSLFSVVAKCLPIDSLQPSPAISEGNCHCEIRSIVTVYWGAVFHAAIHSARRV